MHQRIIVAAIILKEDKILLGKKAKGRPPYPDVWHLPGGGVEDMQKALQLLKTNDFNNAYFHNELRREIKEETNITIKNMQNICPTYRKVPRGGSFEKQPGEITHYIFLEYLCELESGNPTPGDDLAELKWVAKSELENTSLTPPSIEMYKELGWLS